MKRVFSKAPNQSHVAKWKAEQSPDAGWIVTDGNGNNWEEGGFTLAFLDEAKAEGFAYGLTSAQAKSAPAEPVSREAVELFPLDSTPEPGWHDGYESGYNDACAQINAPPSPDAELARKADE